MLKMSSFDKFMHRDICATDQLSHRWCQTSIKRCFSSSTIDIHHELAIPAVALFPIFL